MDTPFTVVKESGTTTREERDAFFRMTIPYWQKYGQQYGFKIISWQIAQGGLESNYGFSRIAVDKKNFLGIGAYNNSAYESAIVFASPEECIQGWFTRTRLGKMDSAKNASTLDEFFKAFVESGYLGDGWEGQVAYYNNIKSAISSYNLAQYDNPSAATMLSPIGFGGSTSNKLEEFVSEALKHVGESFEDWTKGVLGKTGYEAWCADFVWACAKTVGIDGTVISGNPGAHRTISDTVSKCGGKEHSGRSSYSPQRGDLVNFDWDGNAWSDHIGIVTEFKDNVVHTIEGNSSNRVEKRKYDRSSSSLMRFCNPDWSKVGGFASSTGVSGTLFEKSNTRKDAIVREVSYLATVYDPKKKSKIVEYKADTKDNPIRLSIINYTELFQAFWDAGTANMGKDIVTISYDYSKLEPKARECIQYFLDKGLNNAATCGICASIYYASKFRTDYVEKEGIPPFDKATYFGICKWKGSRAAAMKVMAGKSWKTNLTGQLNYLWFELEKGYKGQVLQKLQLVEESASGAKNAARTFFTDYLAVESFGTTSTISIFQAWKSIAKQAEIEEREKKASEYYNSIVKIVKSSQLSFGTSSTNLSSTTSFSSIDYRNLSQVRQTIIKAAESQLGVPYVWGGSEPGVGLDCSGLTQYCYSQAGISIPRTSRDQMSEAPKKVSIDQAEPGDILWMSGHVVLYVGDNQIIEEPDVGKVCTKRTIYSGFQYALKYI